MEDFLTAQIRSYDERAKTSVLVRINLYHISYGRVDVLMLKVFIHCVRR